MPKRIQRKRAKGSSLPADAMFTPGKTTPAGWGHDLGAVDVVDHAHALELFETFLKLRSQPGWRDSCGPAYPKDDEIRYALGGRDLACWCPVGAACHADLLLDIANEDRS